MPGFGFDIFRYSPLMGGTPPVSYLVNDYSPFVALSISRKLSSTATKAIRVRRSSDNAEQDIGFVGIDLDTASLLSFVGAGSGFIAKVYNQGTGGGTHDTTTVSGGVQPRIVNSGVLDTLGGIVSTKFDGSDDCLTNNTSIGATPVTWHRYAVFSQPSANAILYKLGGSFTHCGVNGDGSASSNLASPPTSYFKNGNSITATTRDQIHDNYFTGVRVLATDFGMSTDNAGDWGGYGGFHISGYLNELILFKTDTTSVRTDIENNINDYYAIY